MIRRATLAERLLLKAALRVTLKQPVWRERRPRINRQYIVLPTGQVGALISLNWTTPTGGSVGTTLSNSIPRIAAELADLTARIQTRPESIER